MVTGSFILKFLKKGGISPVMKLTGVGIDAHENFYFLLFYRFLLLKRITDPIKLLSLVFVLDSDGGGGLRKDLDICCAIWSGTAERVGESGEDSSILAYADEDSLSGRFRLKIDRFKTLFISLEEGAFLFADAELSVLDAEDFKRSRYAPESNNDDEVVDTDMSFFALVSVEGVDLEEDGNANDERDPFTASTDSVGLEDISLVDDFIFFSLEDEI
eukprot:scaffold64915_cov45-Attheya_sp.AAC.5